ncbi:small GTP-binding protein [Histomonas meleagridis]|uniref:small GTP-binding protein n=1 Tax=Histomonas meleagridis TaxID=135588 RepID=UPI003559545D|nr:small GTP-binding protein [Histomonas meleagridis]KAH0797787.1 small GTP-binding protein [Histomonas meleagridis]
MRKVKAVFAGDAGVGKTSIISRIVDDTFIEGEEATVGAANCRIEIDTGEGKVDFNVWDTAGQERYRSLAPMYFAGAALAFLVFDITSEESLKQIGNFVKLLQDRAPDYVKFILIGNKSDLTSERAVSEEEGERYALEIEADFYIEVSAKTGMGITDLFTRAAMIPGLHFESELEDEIAIEESQTETNTTKCC